MSSDTYCDQNFPMTCLDALPPYTTEVPFPDIHVRYLPQKDSWVRVELCVDGTPPSGAGAVGRYDLRVIPDAGFKLKPGSKNNRSILLDHERPVQRNRFSVRFDPSNRQISAATVILSGSNGHKRRWYLSLSNSRY